jgi:hypothetical protein
MNCERREELVKLAEGIMAENIIQDLADYAQPKAIQSLSRGVLGIHPEADIVNLEPASQAELLFVMRSIRNTLFPPRLEIDEEPFRSRKF